jgi:hypothetical protein
MQALEEFFERDSRRVSPLALRLSAYNIEFTLDRTIRRAKLKQRLAKRLHDFIQAFRRDYEGVGRVIVDRATPSPTTETRGLV